MIKDFETYINEGRMGRLVNADDSVRKQDELTEEEVRSYIYSGDNRKCKKVTIRYEGVQPIVDIEGDFYFRKDITEIPFQFGKVTGDFIFWYGSKLTSLVGCPQIVGGYFSCKCCESLTSLEGCPKEVGADFSCKGCSKLTSLVGCPEKVGGNFDCYLCENLTSLEGCPKEVGKDFICSDCCRKFTEKEVKSLCNVKRDIIV